MTTLEFTQQVATMRPVLRSFTYRFTKDREESLDLVQDTILRALTYREKFKADTNLKGWLFTIMRNTYINNYRRNQRTKTSPSSANESLYLNLEDKQSVNLPEGSLEFKEVWLTMNRIKEELLVPFKMYTSGYKYHEIAEYLKIPVGTVKNRIFHARKEIQKRLTGYQS